MPSNPTLNTRKLGTIVYSSGTQQSLELDKNGVLLRLFLRLQFTITNGATAPANPLFMALARILRRVEIMAGGRDIVQSVPGYFLALRAAYENLSIPALGMGATVVTTANAVTQYDISIPVQFTLPLGKRADDTALDTTGLTQLSCIITWGTSDCADIFATPNGAILSNMTCSVEGQYIANPLRNSQGAAVSGTTGKPFMVRAFDYQEISVAASNTAQVEILDSRSGLVLTSFLVAALADYQGNDAIINSFALDAASFNFFNRDAQEIRAANVQDLHLINGTTPGVLYLDPRFKGSLTNAINTANLNGDLKATLDLTKQGVNDCRLCIQREAIRPLLL